MKGLKHFTGTGAALGILVASTLVLVALASSLVA